MGLALFLFSVVLIWGLCGSLAIAYTKYRDGYLRDDEYAFCFVLGPFLVAVGIFCAIFYLPFKGFCIFGEWIGGSLFDMKAKLKRREQKVEKTLKKTDSL